LHWGRSLAGDLDRFRKDQELVVDFLQQQLNDMAYWQTVHDFWAAYFKANWREP
jgi:hypothetical protein